MKQTEDNFMKQIDRTMESQENMEAWFQKTISKDSKLYQNGIIPMMEPKFVACNYAEKSLTISFDIKEWQMNPENILHGGMIITAFDTAFGVLSHYFAKQRMITTVTISTTFLKPVLLHDKLIIKVFANSIGRTLVSLTGEARVERNQILSATSNTTFMILDKEFSYTIS